MILTDQELYDKLVDYNEEDPWSSLDEIESRIKYFPANNLKSKPFSDEKFIYSIQYEADKIIGVGKLKTGGKESFMYPENKEWISMISVDKDYQGKGISGKIIEELFQYLSDNNYSEVIVSGYTEEGLKYLRPKIHRVANKLSIKVLDQDKIEF